MSPQSMSLKLALSLFAGSSAQGFREGCLDISCMYVYIYILFLRASRHACVDSMCVWFLSAHGSGVSRLFFLSLCLSAKFTVHVRIN